MKALDSLEQLTEAQYLVDEILWMKAKIFAEKGDFLQSSLPQDRKFAQFSGSLSHNFQSFNFHTGHSGFVLQLHK